MPGKGGSLLGPLADAELGEAGLGRVALHPDTQLLRGHRLRRRPHRRESPPGCCAGGGGGEAEAAGAGAELERGGHHRARHLSQQVVAALRTSCCLGRSSEPRGSAIGGPGFLHVEAHSLLILQLELSASSIFFLSGSRVKFMNFFLNMESISITLNFAPYQWLQEH